MLKALFRFLWGSGLNVFLRRSLLLFVVALAVFVPMMAATVEYTAQPEFCISCHIMDPYYESWVNSSHADVSCIECHYEPGTLETVEGKFKALSQLSKYVTQTQGTKPWAEVSDQSCMRSGCHSVRMLDGPIAFGNVKFDHREHLLESRRGRRLRCTSCHSQVVQGEHVAVTEGVCFTCHFMPNSEGLVPEQSSDCLICHGPPSATIEVAGQPFDHEEYIARGLDCRECHDPVIEGKGTVRRERCHSCHGEIGHIERIGEMVFLHEEHVTEHKVECFECHDEINHGLLPLEFPKPSNGEGCGACHINAHDASKLVYAGMGARGAENRPSRMFETRVVCDACHTGRTGYSGMNGDGLNGSNPHAGAEAHASGSGALVASAGEVDCIHCHGPSFDGMLGTWQSVISGQLERMTPLVASLKEELTDEVSDEVHALYQDARADLELVRMDGSMGAHNIPYVMDILRGVADRVDRAAVSLGEPDRFNASAGLPYSSPDGCSECHLGIEFGQALEVNAREFSHSSHLLEAGLDCSVCHSVEEHGQPTFARNECAQCHHEETEQFDPWDCSRCHALQESLFVGSVDGFAELMSGMEEEKDCDSCHGEPPEIRSPTPKLCVLCHDDEYGPMLESWSTQTSELSAKLRDVLSEAERAGGAPEAIERGRRVLELVGGDGSGGAHNFGLVESLLRESITELE